MKSTQLTKLEKLILKGATAMEIAVKIGTTCPHKRVSELSERGWDIQWKRLPGKTYGVYKGRKAKAV